MPQRPAMTDPGELLLFLTEPQQLDAVYEYGTETLSPASIVIPDEDDACDHCPGVTVMHTLVECVCPDCESERAADDDLDRWIDDTRGDW
jgi:hypothetical protein